MKKIISSLFFIFLSISAFSQVEKYPVFNECNSTDVSKIPSCFKAQIKKAIIKKFKIPKNIKL